MHIIISDSRSALCFLFALALSYILPLCVLACVCTVRYCRNISREKKGGVGGGVGLVGPNLMHSVWVSVREKEGEKNYSVGSERAVYCSDSQDAERDASNEKSHLNCLPFSHTASILLPARFELLKNCLRWAPPPHCLTGKPPNGKMENLFGPSRPLSCSLLFWFFFDLCIVR